MLGVAKGLASLEKGMSRTAQSVRNVPVHVTLGQLVESMAAELNMEKPQFLIEEILQSPDDTDPILDHVSMTEEGWNVTLTTPSDSMEYANTKWFRVSLVTGEDLIPPHTNPSQFTETVNIGPKGAPMYVQPQVMGYQSMTAMAMLSALRSKLTIMRRIARFSPSDWRTS